MTLVIQLQFPCICSSGSGVDNDFIYRAHLCGSYATSLLEDTASGTLCSIFYFFGNFKYCTIYSIQKLSMDHNSCRYMEFRVTFHFIYRTTGIICPFICCNFGAWFCSVCVVTHNNESNEGQRDGSEALIKLVCVTYGCIHLTRSVIGDGPQVNPSTVLPMFCT